MFVLNETSASKKLIEITKSNSGISGPELAITHIELGKLLGKHMKFDPNNTTIVAIMRGGIFFAEGIYFETGYKFSTFNPKLEKYKRPKTKYVILVDSVINTGKTLLNLLDDNTFVACCVINEKIVNKFYNRLFSIRISENSYVGSNVKKQKGNIGPDTTMRLFNQI